MKKTTNYEETRKILEDNIIRLIMEKNLTARALSIRIEKNDWYITRMLNGKIDPSLDVLFHIAEALRVEPAELCTTKIEYLMSAKNTGNLIVHNGKGGQPRPIKLKPEHCSMIG